MWDHLTSNDLHRAKEEIERRRAEAVDRHLKETKTLEAKQAEETQALNAKQVEETQELKAKLTEIKLLDGMINMFTEEFKREAAHSKVTGEMAEAAVINSRTFRRTG